MTFVAALFLYPSTILIGFLLAIVLGVKNFWEKIGVGWLLGTGLITYAYFLLYAYAGWRYTAGYTMLLFLAVIVILLVLIKSLTSYTWNSFKTELVTHFARWKSFRDDKVTLLLMGLIFIPVLFGVLLNLHWPVMDWDAIALYDFRAKVFTISGGMEDGIIRGYFLHYPLYTSLLHTFSYLFGIQSARLWYSLFYISSLLVFYSLLQRRVAQKQALVGTFILAITPQIFQHSQMTYTNLPHAMYVAFGYMYLWEWWRTGKKVDLLIGAGMIACSTWVRLTEPLWIPALGILVLGAWRRKTQWLLALAMILLIILVRYPWTSFVTYHDNLSITNPLQIGGGLQLPTHPWDWIMRVYEVTEFFWISIYLVISVYIPALFVAFLYVLYQEKWDDLWEYAFFALLVLFIYAGVFLFSFQFEGWQKIPDSAARMAMFLLPIAIYLMMKSELWLVSKHKKTAD